MENVVEFENKYESCKVFFIKVVPQIVNDELREYVYICKRNENGLASLTYYSGFFFAKVCDRNMINLATNTKLNAYGRYIVTFLNYIFYESEDKIVDIRDLKLDLVNEYLEKHSRGSLANQKRGWKNKGVADEAAMAITYFIYWLTTSRINNRKTLGLKYIKNSLFKTEKYLSYNPHTGSRKEKERLKSIGVYQTTQDNKSRKKVVTANLFSIKALIDISKKNDPMMTFGIVLGAFVGLREGGIVQMTKDRISPYSPLNVLEGCSIDLYNNNMTRGDGKGMGSIKISRKQPVYEAFLQIFDKAYSEHLELLKKLGYDKNKYGALFIDDKGHAMSPRTYLNRFYRLVKIMKNVFLDEALAGNIYAAKEYEKLIDADNRLTPHSLRHFYTQTIEKLEKDLLVVQYYRGDNAIESQEVYKGNMSSVEGLERVTNSMKEELEKYGFDSII